MNSIRVVSVCLAVASVFSPRFAHAQTLEERVAALEAAVAKLQSGQVDAADLVGTYAVHEIGVELGANPARTRTESSAGTATLNADGTFTFTGVAANCTLREGMPWTVTCDERLESVTATWTVENGRLIVQQSGEELVNAAIGAGGRVLIFGGTATAGGFTKLEIAVRLPNP